MSITLPKTCAFEGSQTGLVGTIGVTLLNPDGTTKTARTTSGIYEIAGGCYGKNITFDDDWKGSIKWDTGGATPLYAVEDYSHPTVEAIADQVWDEILTGATHNIATSAGRKLREAADVMVLREEETAQGGTLSSITLNAAASSEDTFYDMSTLVIVSGTGAGQARTFTDYNGTTKVGVPCEDWVIAPDNTSRYIIRGHACSAVYKMDDSVYSEIWDRIKKLIPFTF